MGLHTVVLAEYGVVLQAEPNSRAATVELMNGAVERCGLKPAAVLSTDKGEMDRATSREGMGRRFAAALEDAGIIGPSDRGEAIGALLRALQTLATSLRDEERAVRQTKATEAQGRALEFTDPEPWDQPVDGAALLSELAGIFVRYLVLADGAAEVIALWVVSSYVYDVFDHCGYLAIVSPTKGCAKTTALRLLHGLVRRALGGENVTAAALFRVVEKSAPTLLIDEVDRIDRDSEVWGILNSGHTKGGTVLRVVGEDMEPRAFATYCPKIVAYIRRPRSSRSRTAVPDTLEDRTIRITLQKKRRDEERPKVRSRTIEAEAVPLRRRLMRWALDYMKTSPAWPEMPEDLDDRAADCWEAIIAVADAAGAPWPTLARDLAVRYSAERAEDDREDPGVLVLIDLLELLDTGVLRADEWGLAGASMAQALHRLPERPWGKWGRDGSGITEAGLARLLRPFGLKTEMAGPKHARVRRYQEAAVRDAGVRVAQTRTPAHQAETDDASNSAESNVRVCGFEAHAGESVGCGARTPGCYFHPDGRHPSCLKCEALDR
jgi:putative DNA primase/helicase